MKNTNSEYVASENLYLARKDSFKKFLKDEILNDNLELLTYNKVTGLDYYFNVKRKDTGKYLDINVRWAMIDDKKGLFMFPDWDYYYLTDNETPRVAKFLKELY